MDGQDPHRPASGAATLPAPRAVPRRRRFSLLPRGGATELGAFREGEHPRVVQERDARFRRTLAAADVLATAIAVAVLVVAHGSARHVLLFLLLLPLVICIGKIAGLYDRDENLIAKSTLDELPTVFQVVTLNVLLVWLLESALVGGRLAPGAVLAFWASMLTAMGLARAGARRMVLRSTATERCLVLGDPCTAEQLAKKVALSPVINAEVVGYIPLNGHRPPSNNGSSNGRLPVLGSVTNLPAALWTHRIDRVVIDSSTTPTGDRLLDKIRLIKAVGVKVSLLPRLLEVVGWSVVLDEVEGLPLLGVRGYGLTKSSRFLKRSLDVAGSLGTLILLAPLLLAIALAVKLSSRGPVLFRQRRVGLGGRPFDLLKFRTMYDGADERKHELVERNEADGLFKIADDPRVTPIGKVLRRWSLDELPQLWNVLRGEMSLVGPRPLVAEEDRRIQGWLRRRLDVTPGMTGMWQVLGSARLPLHEMVKLDYLYRANWSLWLDLKILLRTVPFVLERRGL